MPFREFSASPPNGDTRHHVSKDFPKERWLALFTYPQCTAPRPGIKRQNFTFCATYVFWKLDFYLQSNLETVIQALNLDAN